MPQLTWARSMSPDSAAVAREVGVVQDVVVEAVGREDVAAVVGLVERPVVAQALGHEHQHAVVAQLVVLDDRQRLERLSEADAVGDDAAAEAVRACRSRRRRRRAGT